MIAQRGSSRVRAMRRACIVLAVATSLLVGAGPGTTASARVRGVAAGPDTVLRIGQPLSSVQGGQPFELDPAKSDLLQIAYLRLIYDTLIHTAADGSLRPGLATKWTVVDDSTISQSG